MKGLVTGQPQKYGFDFSNPDSMRGGRNRNILTEEDLPPLAEYYVNDEQIAVSFGQILKPVLADWIDVAVAVYFADRLAVRSNKLLPRKRYQWGRIINLRVGVREPQIWQQLSVSESLRRLLYFITEDEWNIEFVERRAGKRRAEENVQGLLFPLVTASKPMRVALYSGGLDSFAGTIRQMYEHPDYEFVLVSGVTNSRQQARQRRQVAEISHALGNDPTHITVPLRRHWQENRRAEEWSQRARGFLFLTLGSVTSLAAGAQELFVYENGVGAINLPINGTQVGTYNSRAINPITLIRMADFVRTLTGQEFAISNPFLFKTKGEMCKHEAVRKLSSEIAKTFSCDGFPVHAKGRPQCGTCTSCLLRRVSLVGANLTEYDPGDEYLVDLLSTQVTPSERQLQNLRAMDWQAQKIKRSLSGPASWSAMKHEFPELRKIEEAIISKTDEDKSKLRRALLRLYEKYVSEWDKFSLLCPALGRRIARVA